MRKTLAIILILIFLLSSCSLLQKEPDPSELYTPTPTPTATPLPEPKIMTTEVPDPTLAADAFLKAWQAEDYLAMFNMLCQVSRDSIDYEYFRARYNDAAVAMTLKSLGYEITSSLTGPNSSQVAFHVTYETVLAGMLSRDNLMDLVLEAGTWKVQWQDTMVMPELEPGNRLVMDIQVPPRGTIYDRNGVALAYQTRAYALGVVPAQVQSSYWSNLINEFSRLTGKTPQVISELMNRAEPTEYLVIGEVTADKMEERYSYLWDYDGVYVNEYTAGRYYTEGGIGVHMIGYVLPISAEEAEDMQRQGYRVDERIGSLGIEAWGQEYLAGKRGASLYVVDAEGNTIDRLSRTEAEASYSIYTTYDEQFEYDLQRAVNGLNAAVVVLERDTGRVLGMASAPGFDANLLDFNNTNAFYSGNLLYNNDRPMYNRATQGQYPLGSVFKIIGMAAALETGIYDINDTYECGHYWNELDGIELHDWTLDHEVAPSGTLTLSEGLMRSCNPWFYKIGKELYQQVGPDALPDMARAFGLGSLTGIGELEEEPGNVDTPTEVFAAVQLGIGQSTLLVTPLQVARFIAAIGNGGTLYRPQVVEQIVDAAGNVVAAFEPEAQGQLPVSPEHLQMIQDAMETVVRNPRGTAYSSFVNTKYEIHAKTGSASTNTGLNSNAWFAGYTNEGIEGKPDIAIAVLAEFAGEGSEVSVPIFRRVIELYFEGQARSLYGWETGVYITKTPSPTPTNTPTPRPTRAPWEVVPEEETENEG
ncbi:MAG: hypothetical protein IJI14_09155 [Anaerolineaceae bacterium]|nr:hypothetical protein [Anaerolineaceae bacterium]